MDYIEISQHLFNKIFKIKVTFKLLAIYRNLELKKNYIMD